ncbi:MAG: hypothetical protein IKV32_00070 [Muribaculaceae bacterium]|nr:hypothetical protein [Muribaculaceae bacterium]
MKKLYSILLTVVATSSSIATAQQLPNVGFEEWKTTCGSTEAFGSGGVSASKTGEMRVRPGIEPAEWNGSSVNQKVVLTKKQELVFREQTYFANGSSSVVLKNITVGAAGIESVAPGFLTLGTPWVYAVASLSKCDGGIYGGMPFTYKPDAVTGKFMRIDSNNENSYIIAYLWNGTFTSKVGENGAPTEDRNDEIRAIWGKAESTGNGKLVAKCDYGFNLSRPADLFAPEAWTEITVPLEYVDGAGEPTMMNVIISGGDYWSRDALVEKTSLLADDVKFIYYSRLADYSVNGAKLEGFSSDVYEYNVPGELPAEEEIIATVVGQSATKTIAIDETNLKVSITVSNVEADVDGNNSHTYVFKYENASIANIEVEDKAPVEYYNLQGVKVANPTNGVLIKVQGGKASKVLIK